MAPIVFRAITLALGQLAHNRFLRIVGLGILASFAALAGLFALLRQALIWAIGGQVHLPWIGDFTISHQALGWASLGAMLAMSIFLMVPIAQAVQSVFLDEIADAVEDRHYPTAKGRAMPFGPALMAGLRAFGIVILANTVALLLYLLLPPFAPFIFVGVNGFLLGQEYYALSAQRHMPRAKARAAARRDMLPIWVLGALMVVPLTIPVLNLIVPVLGAASFTHLFHLLNARR